MSETDPINIRSVRVVGSFLRNDGLIRTFSFECNNNDNIAQNAMNGEICGRLGEFKISALETLKQKLVFLTFYKCFLIYYTNCMNNCS